MPLLRPGFFGFFFRFPRENGAACRLLRRRDSSNSFRSRAISACAFSSCFRMDSFSLRRELIKPRRDSLSSIRRSTVRARLESSGGIQRYSTELSRVCPAVSHAPAGHVIPTPVNKYLWPKVNEDATSTMGSDGKASIHTNFCPEVTGERFGWFASFLARYADELDSDLAARG